SALLPRLFRSLLLENLGRLLRCENRDEESAPSVRPRFEVYRAALVGAAKSTATGVRAATVAPRANEAQHRSARGIESKSYRGSQPPNLCFIRLANNVKYNRLQNRCL